MRRIRNAVAIAAAFALVVALAVGLYPLYTSSSDGQATSSPSITRQTDVAPSSSPETPSQTPKPTAKPSQLTLVGGGDILLHMPVNEDARTPTGYDYTGLLSGIHSYISGADLAICGMETSLAPPGEAPSGYPLFGAPDGIVASLKANGWDGCSTANNHSADRGFAQVTHTLDVFDEQGLGHAGTARSAEEGAQTQFFMLRSGGRDVRIAHLSYTNVDNGIPGFADKPWAWNTVMNERATHSIEEIIERSRAARELGADLVVVSFHWGVEYMTSPSADETTAAQQLADSGAIDLVLGSHPHVAQPITKLDGGPDGQGMWIIYSMGNAISNQNPLLEGGINVLTGVLATATIDVPAVGPAHVSNLEWTAITLDRATHHVYLLADLESGAQVSTITGADLTQRRATINAIMGTPERTTVPVNVAEYVGQERR